MNLVVEPTIEPAIKLEKKNSPKATKLAVYTLLTLFLAISLSSCTFMLDPNQYTVSNTNYSTPNNSRTNSTNYGTSYFVPTKGTGSTYVVGESIQFEVKSPQSGYMTLTVIDPDGSSYIIGQGTTTPYTNIPVRAGQSYSVAGLSLTPPGGLHRIQAAFSAQPITNTNTIYYVDQNGSIFQVDQPNGSTSVNQVKAEANIVLESYFYLR